MKYKDKVIKNIIEYVKTNYKRINKDEMILGDSYYNYRCHLNAIQYIKTGKADEVYLCVYIEDKYPIVHFINKKDGKYIDNTLGWLYENIEYYIIKKVEEDEYNNIVDLLTNTQRTIVKLHTNAFYRWLFGVKVNNFI